MYSPPRETFVCSSFTPEQSQSQKLPIAAKHMAGLQSAKLITTCKKQFSLRLYCSSIFHRLSLAAVSRLEDSSAPFSQTNDFSSAAISFSQNYSFICKMGSTDQWCQPFLHTKCVECIWKIQQISPALSQMATAKCGHIRQTEEKTRKTFATS